MDFGLGKYLEMFEERFGRKATTALICLLTFALVALCIRTIYIDLAKPLYGIAVAIESNESIATVFQRNVVALITTSVMCFLAGQLLLWLIMRKYRVFHKELTDKAAELQSLSEQVRTMYLASMVANKDS